MFVKLTRSGGRAYAQLVESFRDETGKPRQRTVATIGRIDEAGGQVRIPPHGGRTRVRHLNPLRCTSATGDGYMNQRLARNSRVVCRFACSANLLM